MKFIAQLRPALRGSALAVLLAAIALWLATGARLGWTQTSTVQLRTDEITGIEYPVRHANFVAGVEIPLAAVGIAAVLAGLSFVTVRRAEVKTPRSA